MARKHITSFKVKGTLAFPIDMLRYDECYPRGQDDVMVLTDSIADHERGQYTPSETSVELTHTDFHKGWMPTNQRWESFGWEVVSCKSFVITT